MTEALDQKVLDRVLEQIVKVLRPERVILFGSHARGEAEPDSDVDILVVAEVEDVEGFRTVGVRRAVGDLPFSMDLLVVTPEEWETWRRFVNTVMGQADKYGRVLYEQRPSAVVG